MLSELKTVKLEMERIHVTVRSRPLSPEDAKTSPWRISANSILVANHTTKFEFDRIFGEDCKTGEVYEARTKEIVEAAVRGFNGTVFAYGQTNSGKTHTMRGSVSEPGVIPLAVHDLFNILQQDVDREFLLRMSYMEIYNEEINDLLAPEHRKLQIHESIERGIYVAGLREEIVASPQQVLDLMEFGESHRHIGETNMNLHSSRSHTIFRMIIESRDRTEDGDRDTVSSCDAVRVSVLNLVDLAGSERAAKTGAEGVRLKEGSHINKSLMTLGTVIKKLSEGAESQGGHVPYRDSKLTRILQPALGGNANTAIICNITLAQIHADETKSSLQFASRALRVTNCARVNEILTDAALLKRQKKEIEELRAKLQGNHSEHLEEEILNLRNTLLQSELERERIALELEEEKKAQVERERVLQEQAKKIKNLSSMVLYSSRDESRDHVKKGKRRDTWCPGNLVKEALKEAHSSVQSNSSAIKPTESKRYVGPLLAFEELVNENETEDDYPSKQDEDCKATFLEDCTLPDPCALLHVTNRRKVLPRKKSSFAEDSELLELQTEYEDLLLEFETQRTMSDIQIDCLTRKLVEADSHHNMKYSESNDHSSFHANKINYADKNAGLREFEAILVIKQLQEKIKILETEKLSSQENLNCLAELATEQNICAREKFDELCEELLSAQEEARVVREKLAHDESGGSMDGICVFANELSKEVEDMISEAQESKEVAQNLSSIVDEAFQSFSAIIKEFVDFKVMMCQSSVQQNLLITNTEQLHRCMRERTLKLENDKLLLQNQILELRENAKNHEASLTALSEEHDTEKFEYLSHIQSLEKEISYFSSGSMAKENQSLSKDLEKTKMKLKDTESKLKNIIQEKTKLEGEKAFSEREIKRLLGQKTLLERDISKRDSLAGRRRDSVFDKNAKVFDPKKAKALEQTMQEDYKKLEVLAFEMETTIASLEEELAAAHKETEVAISRSEDLALEFESLTEKLDISSSEINALQEELSGLKLSLEQSNSNQQGMETSIKSLLAEKEELAMQLTNSLLEMEEERAIQCAKEKASIEAIEEKTKLYNSEITSLSETLSEVMKELELGKNECDVLRERLTCCVESAELEKKCSIQKSLEIDQLKSDIENAYAESKQTHQILNSNVEKLSLELQHTQEQLSIIRKERDDLSVNTQPLVSESHLSDELQNLRNQLLDMSTQRNKLKAQIEELQSCLLEVENLRKDSNELMKAKVQVEELTSRISGMEVKTHNDHVNNGKDMAKLRMRLCGTQAQLGAFRYRYKKVVDESDIMNSSYKEASADLKKKLASKAIEVLNLKKQLATTASGQ